jgi:membrane protein YqaA with SNARE-associated domain
MVLYESVGRWFLEAMAYQDAYDSFEAFFDRQGFIAILAVGIVPIPFQIAMIAAGLAGYPLYLFVLAAGIARGIRYYGLAWLVMRFGGRARRLWQRHAVLASLGAAGIVAALWFAGQFAANQVM